MDSKTSNIRSIISSEGAPAAIGAYSQGVRINYGNFSVLNLSGQIGMDPSTGDLVSDDVEDQTRRALTSVKNLLEDNGSSFDKIIKATLFLVDMGDFSKVDNIYKTFFTTKDVPARAAVAVASLPKGAKFEIIVEAICDEDYEFIDKK